MDRYTELSVINIYDQLQDGEYNSTEELIDILKELCIKEVSSKDRRWKLARSINFDEMDLEGYNISDYINMDNLIFSLTIQYLIDKTIEYIQYELGIEFESLVQYEEAS